jgi:competence protein ComEA
MKTIATVIGAAILALAALLLHPSRPAEPAIRADAARPLPEHSAPLRAVVYVVGKVARPGLYTVAAGARVDDAIHAAGGIERGGDPAAVNLAERVADGEEILVPALGEVLRAKPAARGRVRRPKKQRGRRRKPATVSQSVDLNTATAGDLARIPGIDDDLARRIVAVRSLDGRFLSVEDLNDVQGISEHKLQAIATYLVVR